MIKTSWIYILFYIQLALILNLVIYASVAIIYEIVKATYIFKPFVRYTFGMLQPVMVLPIIVFETINLRPCHLVYLVIIGIILFIEIFIIIFWIIALAVRPILFGRNFLAGTPPFDELDRDGAFEWFFEKTGADVKTMEITRYILNLLRDIMSPEDFDAAEQRCFEKFVSGSGSSGKTPFKLPPKDHIEYDYEKIFETEERTDDKFYKGSYLSIKHRSDANSYKNMAISRPDMPTWPEMPDVKNTITTEINYVNIKL
jgi:hypothetical protein